MIRFSFLLLFFLVSCSSPKPKTAQEMWAQDQAWFDPSNQKRAIENNMTLVRSEDAPKSWLPSVGGVELTPLRWSYSFHVRMQCDSDERDLFPILLKNKKVQWKIGTDGSGEVTSDNKGDLNFTYSTLNAERNSPLIVEFLGRSYRLPITTSAPMILVIHKDDCAR